MPLTEEFQKTLNLLNSTLKITKTNLIYGHNTLARKYLDKSLTYVGELIATLHEEIQNATH